MKHYRFKNEKELSKEYGKDWRKESGVGFAIDDLLGHDLDDSDSLQLEEHDLFLVDGGFINREFFTEVSPLAHDIEKTYIDLEKGKVTVILKNGNEGRSVCAPGDTFDPQVGIALAYTRAIMGSTTQFKKYVDLKVKRAVEKANKKFDASQKAPVEKETSKSKK